MGTYRFNKYSQLGVVYFAIEEKRWYGWGEVKVFPLSFGGTHTVEEERKAYKDMMEAVDRLIAAGNTVI